LSSSGVVVKGDEAGELGLVDEAVILFSRIESSLRIVKTRVKVQISKNVRRELGGTLRG
jgi:hypothetical protein